MFRGEETWEVMFEGVAVLKMSLSLVSNYVHYYGTVYVVYALSPCGGEPVVNDNGGTIRNT